MDNKLKPCPFCGTKLSNEDDEMVRVWHKGTQFSVRCPECQTDGPIHGSIGQAIAAWNTRAERPVLKAGQRVMVNNERYHGEGIVVGDDGEYRRMVQVLLGNGNTWPYEFETVTLVDAGRWAYEREQIVPSRV